MISVQNISKSYPTRFGEKLVLDDISFDLKKGEKLGILGRNGAGKSTLVRVISGAELPSKGRVLADMSVSWPLAFGGAFESTLTGVDNVRFISRIYKQDFKKNLAFVEDFAELGPYLREEVRTYSSGMRARLAFAISMIIEFDCFLIDEVGAVGDARFHQRCRQELFEKRSDRAMVIISHDAAYLRDNCTRFALLHEGRLTEFDDFDAAFSDFREKIGIKTALSAQQNSKSIALPADRSDLIEITHTAAVRDDAFKLLVSDADWKRDQKLWVKAENAYKKALDLYPYQRSYWVQKGHCAKEAGGYRRAEAAYRTACALGEPFADVEPHLLFTFKKLGTPIKRFPISTYSGEAAKDQPPGIPDVELFARATWHKAQLEPVDMLGLLQANPTCDQLLASMIDDPRFVGEEHKAKGPISTNIGIPLWVQNLITIAIAPENSPETAQDRIKIARLINTPRDAWPVLMRFNAFKGWEATQAAIERRKSDD